MQKKLFFAIIIPYVLLLIAILGLFLSFQSSYALKLTETTLDNAFNAFISDQLFTIENYENYESKIKKDVEDYKAGRIFYAWLLRSDGEELAVSSYQEQNFPEELEANAHLFIAHIRANQPVGKISGETDSTYKLVRYSALGQTDLVIAIVADIPKDSLPKAEGLAAISIIFILFLAIGLIAAALTSNSLSLSWRKTTAYAAMLFNDSAPEEPPKFKDSETNALIFFIKGIASKKTVYIDEDRNPITHMHGAARLETELYKAIDGKNQFAVCEISLNYLTAYANKYGAGNANRLIRLAGAIIESAAEEFGWAGQQVYHIDQKRFVIITSPDKAKAMSQSIILSFDQHVKLMYDETDINKGFVVSKDQNGDINSFPIATLTIAIATNQYIPLIHPLQIAHITNEILTYLSQRDYSCYMTDRRRIDRSPYSSNLANNQQSSERN